MRNGWVGAGILQRKATNLVLFLVSYEQARALYSKADLKDSFADYDSDLYPCSKDMNEAHFVRTAYKKQNNLGWELNSLQMSQGSKG